MSWFNVLFEPVYSLPRWQDPHSSVCLSLVAAAAAASKVEQKELEVTWLLHGSSFYRLALNSLKKNLNALFSACERWALGVLPGVVSHAGEVGGGTLALLNSDSNLGIRSCLHVFIQRPHSQRKAPSGFWSAAFGVEQDVIGF